MLLELAYNLDTATKHAANVTELIYFALQISALILLTIAVLFNMYYTALTDPGILPERSWSANIPEKYRQVTQDTNIPCS